MRFLKPSKASYATKIENAAYFTREECIEIMCSTTEDLRAWDYSYLFHYKGDFLFRKMDKSKAYSLEDLDAMNHAETQ